MITTESTKKTVTQTTLARQDNKSFASTKDHREAFTKHLFILNLLQKSKTTYMRTPAAISSAAWRKFYEIKNNKNGKERSKQTKERKFN